MIGHFIAGNPKQIMVKPFNLSERIALLPYFQKTGLHHVFRQFMHFEVFNRHGINQTVIPVKKIFERDIVAFGNF